MTIKNAVIDALRAELANFIRDECDLHQCDEANLPETNKVFLNGARRLVERIEKTEGVPHRYITAVDATPRPTPRPPAPTRPRIQGKVGMMASCREATVDYDLPPGTTWDKVRDGENGPYEWTIVADQRAEVNA